MLKMLADNNINVTERFQNAEQLWFWFVYSKSAQNGFIHHCANTKRPCELLDVETLITKLYLSGKLSDEQLKIMKKFGDKRRAPHQYIYSENKAAMLWKNAMDTLKDAANKKGWLID
ncbi:MAG: hypothetical protein IJL05_04565 [Alphaproteobacteria bacterium]|nr:hypothetical protein [Alphaproteobacteria bacterium]